jgi:hypothetical protein
MPYVSRNEQGIISEIHQTSLNGQEIWLENDDPELLIFLQQNPKTELAKHSLAITDLDMVRTIEDLVDLLMSKNIFIFTDLPLPVQEKLSLRKQLRKDMHSLDNLIGEDDGIF